MKQLQPTDFTAFFGEIYTDPSGNPLEPFPWQRRLAERVCEGDWPACIALPTAAGKTACIDIAVFALACQAHRPPNERTAPRRMFFVVDRRVVVDQALLHARHLAQTLEKAESGVARQVADALRQLAGGTPVAQPLDCYALRGGMYRDNTWVRSPLQPTVVTATVDQVGSRLLFRGYGVSDSSKPLHAALVGNDALILLDEAHCSKPFAQTVGLVEKYREWAEEGIHSPFRFVSMTATPTDDVIKREQRREREQPETPSLIFAMDGEDRAHQTLGARISMSKPARLVVAEKAKGKSWRRGLVSELAKQARSLAERFASVGIIVNRVATARDLARELDAVLVTGRMRPLDRDRLYERHLKPLLSNQSGSPPQYVVATQCLEVGADLDFHALVTECASLDALRQRFGRLNRVAARDEGEAIIVIRADQTQPAQNVKDVDPVYGNSLAATWDWLNQNAIDGVVDFGVAAVQARTAELSADVLAQLNAPASDAAVLLPAHLDLWCQTNPSPKPDPDPAPFLHGLARGVPDVQIVFRGDLGNDPQRWAEIVSLCPPSSSEALPVRIDVFKRWLANKDVMDESSDVEGEVTPADEELEAADRCVLLWCGPISDRSRQANGQGDRVTHIVKSPDAVLPNETYVVPITASDDYSSLGDFIASQEDGQTNVQQPTDMGDEAFQRARNRAILRLRDTESLAGATLDDEDFEEKLKQALEQSFESSHEWKKVAARALRERKQRIVTTHPSGGFVVVGRKRLKDDAIVAPDASWHSHSLMPVPLDDHCAAVSARTRLHAELLGMHPRHVEALASAGLLHDVGKADPRFQTLMHGGNYRRLSVYPQLVAKSVVLMATPREREKAREQAGLPKGFRHEMLSLQLAESCLEKSMAKPERDLALHVIGSHHGHGRPLAPVVCDSSFPAVRCNGTSLSHEVRKTLVPPHRLDSGVAERFWTLTRRFGWWGLAYFESMLRLADWAVSDEAERTAST